MPRLALFGPVPPARSGLASYIEGLLPQLPASWEIELFADVPGAPASLDGRPVHDVDAWAERHAAAPFDLDIYQLGNDGALLPVVERALERPGLVILHDVVLHPMRAAHYLAEKNMTRYRHALEADDPELGPAAAKVIGAGLAGPSLFWSFPLSGDIMNASHHTLVHGELLAECVRAEYAGTAPSVSSAPLWLSVAEPGATAVEAWRERLGATPSRPLLGTFGHLGPEHRVDIIFDVLGELVEQHDVRLVVVGGMASGFEESVPESLRDHVTLTGHVDDDDYGALLRAVDLGLNLRYPTARAASGPLAQMLSVGTPAVIHDLVHQRDIPSPAVLRVPTGAPDEERAALRENLRRWLTDDVHREQAADAAQAFGAGLTAERLAAGWEHAVNAALAAKKVAS